MMGFSDWSTASAAGVAYLDRGVEERERAEHEVAEDEEEEDEAKSDGEGRTVLSARLLGPAVAAGMALKGLLLRGARRSEASMVRGCDDEMRCE